MDKLNESNIEWNSEYKNVKKKKKILLDDFIVDSEQL